MWPGQRVPVPRRSVQREQTLDSRSQPVSGWEVTRVNKPCGRTRGFRHSNVRDWFPSLRPSYSYGTLEEGQGVYSSRSLRWLGSYLRSTALSQSVNSYFLVSTFRFLIFRIKYISITVNNRYPKSHSDFGTRGLIPLRKDPLEL